MKIFSILLLITIITPIFAMTQNEVDACLQQQTAKTQILELSTLLQNISEPWESNDVEIEEYYTLRNLEYSGDITYVGDYFTSYAEYAAKDCDQLIDAANTLTQRLNKAHKLMREADAILESLYLLHQQ